jgi:hypothetical protein
MLLTSSEDAKVTALIEVATYHAARAAARRLRNADNGIAD